MRNPPSRRQALALAIAEDRAGQEVVRAMEQAKSYTIQIDRESTGRWEVIRSGAHYSNLTLAIHDADERQKAANNGPAFRPRASFRVTAPSGEVIWKG